MQHPLCGGSSRVSAARGMLLPNAFFSCPCFFFIRASAWSRTLRQLLDGFQSSSQSVLQNAREVSKCVKFRERERERERERDPHTQLAFGCPCLDGHTRKLHYFWRIWAAHMHSQHLSERASSITSAYVSICQHTSGYVRIRPHTIRPHTSAFHIASESERGREKCSYIYNI